MKKLLICVAALAMLLSVAGAAMAQDLVIYSARNERLNNIVIPAFEEATGLKVELITGSSGEVLQRVKAEVENGSDGRRGSVQISRNMKNIIGNHGIYPLLTVLRHVRK